MTMILPKKEKLKKPFCATVYGCDKKIPEHLSPLPECMVSNECQEKFNRAEACVNRMEKILNIK